MNKVNNLGENIFVNCMNCNHYLRKRQYCNQLLQWIPTSSYAENCNSFDCDKNLKKVKSRDEFPRRCQMQKWCAAELAIFNAMGEVEKMPADVMLTNAINLLKQASDKVADYIDANPSYNIEKPKKKRVNRYNQFILDNKGKLYNAFRHGLVEDGHNTEEGKRVVDLARVELGYSSKTWDGDIYNALYRNWFRLVVENK